ncbi:exonuclease SbcCD subunit D [Aquipuribacter nitratireducens]|uniref:Nuclease SbcCD subunit D n=1 Tax=Aquipuribacter nitratireducens TaxID=650104 RepID=A0ABW0GK57_9MICO
MRLLHTSDWHLGRRLHGADLTEAHAAWVDHLVEVVVGEHVDVVVVAGDVFDRAIPPVAAVRLWDEALQRLRAAGAAVVVSSGNHDSPARLGAHGALLAELGVHVRCDPARVAEPVVLHDTHGPVAFYPLPYLEPVTATSSLPDTVPGPARSQAAVVGRAVSLATAHAAQVGHGRTVLLAHTWVAGVGGEDRCDSEREIGVEPPVTGGSVPRVGGVDRVPTEPFRGTTYTALGHLHGPRTLDEHLRYSGSPVAFSFSERNHRKGSWLVDIGPDGLERVERVEAPVHRGLAQLRGTLEQLLGDPAHAVAEHRWVKAVLTDPARPAEAMRRLQDRFPHALALEWEPEGRAPELPYAVRLAAARTDTEVATGFVEHVRGTPATAAEATVLDAAFRAVRAAATGEPVAASAAPAADELAALDDVDGLDGLDGLDADLLAGATDVPPPPARGEGAA